MTRAIWLSGVMVAVFAGIVHAPGCDGGSQGDSTERSAAIEAVPEDEGTMMR